MKKFLAFILAFAMIFSLAACSGKTTESTNSETSTSAASSSETAAATSNASEASAESSESGDDSEFDGEVYVGLLYAQTGNSTYLGDCDYHAILASVHDINEAGGILGKKVVLVTEDEGDSVDSSVKGMQKLLADDRLIAICGSLYSPRAIAVVDDVEERGIPCFVYGSSPSLYEAAGPHMWMTRGYDTLNAKGIGMYVASIGAKNPAFIYAQTSFGDGYRVAIIDALAEEGISCDESLMFGISEEDTNFTNQIAQIAASDADVLIALGTNPAPYIVQQVADAGLDIPKIGSGAFCNDTVFTQCGEAANGWICQAEWTNEADTPEALAYKETLMEIVGDLNTASQACCYPSLIVLKQACEIAGTTEDPEAINEAIKQVRVSCPNGVCKYNGDQCLGTQTYMVEVQDGNKAVIIDTVVYRPTE